MVYIATYIIVRLVTPTLKHIIIIIIIIIIVTEG